MKTKFQKHAFIMLDAKELEQILWWFEYDASGRPSKYEVALMEKIHSALKKLEAREHVG